VTEVGGTNEIQSINPMQRLKLAISPFFAHLGSMTRAGDAVPLLRR
jgi:hypothetical protein